MSLKLALWVCATSIAVLLVVVFTLNHRPISEVVRSCYSNGCFDLEAGQRLLPLIQPFVRGTRFDGKVNVSSAPLTDHINFYVAAGAMPSRLASLKCNCAYVGANIVICDHSFLETFATSVGFTRDSFYGEGSEEIWKEEVEIFAKVNEAIAAVLRSWLIGHEIGHAVLHAPRSTERRIAVTRHQEDEADAFFIEKAASNADQNAMQRLHSGINQLIFQIITITFKDGKARVSQSADGIHDPWIMRAMALGQLLTDLSGQPENDFYKSLSQNISAEPGGGNIGSFCEFQNLREQAAKIQLERIGSK